MDRIESCAHCNEPGGDIDEDRGVRLHEECTADWDEFVASR